MTISNRSVALFVLMMLVLALALVFRPVPAIKTGYTPPSAEVTGNELYALGQLVSAAGGSVTMHAELPDSLPPPASVLWLRLPGNMIGEVRLAAILAWVRAGGTLVVAPGNPAYWTEDDPLLGAAGVVLQDADEETLQELFGEESPVAPRGGLPYALPGDAGERVLFADFSLYTALEAQADDIDGRLCDPAGCRVTRRTLGSGNITVIADDRPFANHSLHSNDHAALALALLGPVAGKPVWLVHRAEVANLFALVWQHAATAVLATLVALLLWTWRASMRFGALLPSPQPDRRRLTEHVDASGALLAHDDGRTLLWKACRDDFLRTLHRRHPQARGMDDASMHALVARLAAHRTEDVRGMLGAAVTDDASFARAVRDLEILRRFL